MEENYFFQKSMNGLIPQWIQIKRKNYNRNP